MKRLTGNYNDANKDDVYTEIQKRREDNAGKEGANLFDGITSNSTKDEMVSALEADDKAGTGGTGKSQENAGVGTQDKPADDPIPDEVKIKRDAATEGGTEITESAKVSGNQSIMVIDVMQSRPVKVHLIESMGFRPEQNDVLVYVEGAVSNGLMTATAARSKFACKPDGTVIYNARGFDDVRPTADFDLVDIVKLIEHNHQKAKK